VKSIVTGYLYKLRGDVDAVGEEDVTNS